jgi:hypothetical protein
MIRLLTKVAMVLTVLLAVQMQNEWQMGFTKVCGMTFEEGQRLMEYHGVNGWKCEENRPYIKRDGEWVEVMRNPHERAVVLQCETDMECQQVTGIPY